MPTQQWPCIIIEDILKAVGRITGISCSDYINMLEHYLIVGSSVTNNMLIHVNTETPTDSIPSMIL